MADTHSKNRKLFIMRYERDKLVAMSQIQSREIRIMELEEEIERCRADIVAQNKLIGDLNKNIQQQQAELEKEKPKEK
jgi:hypothetical protein